MARKKYAKLISWRYPKHGAHQPDPVTHIYVDETTLCGVYPPFHDKHMLLPPREYALCLKCKQIFSKGSYRAKVVN